MKLPASSAPPGAWKRFRYRLEYVGLVAAAALIHRLPYDTLQPLASAIGRLVFALDRAGRATALENLRVAFGRRFSPEEREDIARQSYENFARTMLCLFWSPNLNRQNYQEIIRVEGLDSDPAHAEPTHPGVYFLGHFSNFEWLALFSSYALSPGILIAQNFKNEKLNPIFDRLRSGTGHQMIPRERALIRMLRFVRQGGKVGAAADLSIDPRLGALPIKCFGLWTAGSPMASLLSQREKAPLFLVEMIPAEDGKFRMVLHPRLRVPEGAKDWEIAQLCWDALEPHIRAHPELWLWNYKQWRFRPADAPKADYPAYARPAKRFDKMVASRTSSAE